MCAVLQHPSYSKHFAVHDLPDHWHEICMAAACLFHVIEYSLLHHFPSPLVSCHGTTKKASACNPLSLAASVASRNVLHSVSYMKQY